MGGGKKMKRIISFFLGLLMITGCNINTGNYDDVAQCLTDKDVTMYGTEWCSHCQNQKKAFGDSFDYINFVDCDRYNDECIVAGVEAYPTWKINDKLYVGEKPISFLAGLAGCTAD